MKQARSQRSQQYKALCRTDTVASACLCKPAPLPDAEGCNSHSKSIELASHAVKSCTCSAREHNRLGAGQAAQLGTPPPSPVICMRSRGAASATGSCPTGRRSSWPSTCEAADN